MPVVSVLSLSETIFFLIKLKSLKLVFNLFNVFHIFDCYSNDDDVKNGIWFIYFPSIKIKDYISITKFVES